MNTQDALKILTQFNRKFQNEIKEHRIEENRQKEGYQDYLTQGTQLNQIITKLQTQPIENSKECQPIEIALQTWKEETDKYVPFQFLRNWQYQYIQKVNNAKQHMCHQN